MPLWKTYPFDFDWEGEKYRGYRAQRNWRESRAEEIRRPRATAGDDPGRPKDRLTYSGCQHVARRSNGSRSSLTSMPGFYHRFVVAPSSMPPALRRIFFFIGIRVAPLYEHDSSNRDQGIGEERCQKSKRRDRLLDLESLVPLYEHGSLQ